MGMFEFTFPGEDAIHMEMSEMGGNFSNFFFFLLHILTSEIGNIKKCILHI